MNLDNFNTIAVLGSRNGGKTNLIFDLLSKYKGKKKIVLYAYPKQVKNYKQIYSLPELAKTKDSVIFMDELQNHIKFYQKRMNEKFLELLAVMSHNNNTLIFTTPMSQFITKALDCFIDGFIYTRINDLGSLKNGSLAKRLLVDTSLSYINEWCADIPLGKAILRTIDDTEILTHKNQKIGKSWRA